MLPFFRSDDADGDLAAVGDEDAAEGRARHRAGDRLCAKTADSGTNLTAGCCRSSDLKMRTAISPRLATRTRRKGGRVIGPGTVFAQRRRTAGRISQRDVAVL